MTVGASLIFNDTLSKSSSPYRGLYYETDMSSFGFILREIAKEGYFQVSNLNSDIDLAATLRPFLRDGDELDDRWTCVGLTPAFLHVARSFVHLSYTWRRHRPKTIDPDSEAQQYLKPDFIYERVVNDLSIALYIRPEVVRLLLGPRKACKELENTKFFPDIEWCPMPSRSTRPHCLWEALRSTSTSRSNGEAGSRPVVNGRAGRRRRIDDDDDEDYVPAPARR